jgi:signal transduction histidine kinase
MQHDEIKQEDLLGQIVHSYNNHLAAIMGFCELASLQNDNSEIAEYLSHSLSSGEEAVRLGQALLASIGRLQVPMEEFFISDLLFNIENTIGKKFKLNASNSKDISITTNREWFVNSLIELIVFLQAYSQQDSAVLKVSTNKNHLIISISASNICLQQKLTARLFEPYFSSRNLQGKKDVGLAAVKGFLSQMGGDLIWCERQGFEFSLPLDNCKIRD